ncbi:DUF3383 family protein [Paenibacillus macerans]|uniref:DUF3383 family protein n=1 Tax=Paenibacillus macerans TaxID=44252 RepID=UPI003D3202B7
MAVDKDVTVVIDIQRPTPKTGLGRPLIIGAAASATEFKVYNDLQEVLADFPSQTEIYKAAYAMFGQGEDAPETIAVMQYTTGGLSDFLSKVFTKDWYYLVSTARTVDDITMIGDAVEIDDSRLFVVATPSKDDLSTIFAKKYERTVAFYHTNIANYPDAAVIGKVGSADAGSLTWKFKTLAGIEPLDLTQEELEEIHDLGAITYVTKAGDDVTSEGKTVSGEYIDIIQSKDYLIMSIENAVQKLFNRSPKVRYDNTGIAQIEGEVKTVLRQADLNGMIAHDDDDLPIYSTTFKPRSQVDPLDREKRIYNGGAFEFELSGAIHKSKISGVIKL